LKKIIIGCQYTSMVNITKAMKDIDDKNVILINTDDIKALDADYIYVGNDLDKHKSDTFFSSFLRYPYDLIPPHSETYSLREKIEFYKSIALLFDKISINSLASTWILRNRLFSLKQAFIEGVKITNSILLNDNDALKLLMEDEYAIKALGNCFVTEDIKSLPEKIKLLVKMEEESNGDRAAIFPASLFKRNEIENYFDNIGVAFLQTPIKSLPEYRCYIIGEQVFLYVREICDSFDKSIAKYRTSDYIISPKTVNGMKKLMKKYKLKYICFDMLCNNQDDETVIDINPYGSMPKYEDFPEPSLKLARLLINDNDKS